ncbi:MAG: hypothetical protein IPJ51_17150 [Saprospiraceae bacterium]|nr:hypothetical protein [Saprospiraceae bacterium]
MNSKESIDHSHIIAIKKLTEFFVSNRSTKIENQFFTQFELEEGNFKFCFNNNLPTESTEYYHEFSMVVRDGKIFVEKEFIFFIPKPTDRIIIDEKGLTAKFVMRGIPHSGSATCNPLLKVIFNNNEVFHYNLNLDTSDQNYLLPMFGFYDGNSQKISNRIKQHDVFGYFYVCNKEDFEKFSNYALENRQKEHEFDFNDDPKLSGTGGYWYHESILAYFNDKFNTLNELK